VWIAILAAMALRTPGLVLTGLLASLLAPLTAQKVGAEIPELEWTKTWNFGDIADKKLSDLRGSVVLLEFISVRQSSTTPEVSKLTALHAELAEKGLVVITVTSETADSLEKWIKKHDVKRPVATGFSKAYDLNGVPDAILVGSDGKVLWHDHPSLLERAKLDAALVNAKPAVVLPGLEPVQTMRRSKDFGAAYRTAKQLLEAGGLSDGAKAQATDWMQKWEKLVTDGTAAADQAEANKDLYGMWVALQPLADYYQGVPNADAAKARFDKLMADGKNKREIEAGKKMAAVRNKEATFEYDAAYAILKELAQQFGPTKAGKEAAALMKAYEKDGKLGYDATCGYCKAGNAACPTHRKKKK
jgi:peroxiredoxin